MSAHNPLDTMEQGAKKLSAHGSKRASYDLSDARVAVAEQFATLRGCRDMLREAAKQFRLHGDSGHAVMCDRHADAADAALAKVGAA